MEKISIFWFRRDLRLQDNAGLYHALKSKNKVLPIFIFDKNILNKLEDKADRRVGFIHNAIQQLSGELLKLGSTIKVMYDEPSLAFEKLFSDYTIAEVYTNHDYEPYAIEREAIMKEKFNEKGIAFYTFKDQCIFEKDEVLSKTGTPYTVFTPYSRMWKATLSEFYLKPYPTEQYFNNFLSCNTFQIPSLIEMGFLENSKEFPNKSVSLSLIEHYAARRNFPALPATSKLGVHLRFGTISVRELARKALNTSEIFLNELIWRDFYMNIMHHFPHVGKGLAFRKEYDKIIWRNNESEYENWCNGQTGYPIVDAGMRELNATGFMHNRIRMIVASFLTKHLLIDWRWGEAYFAKKLLDFDLSANNGGWQWASGSGCDAAPYFRVFNPRLQTEKFDSKLEYIKKWVPEFQSFEYPKPIVDHDFARKRVLEVYKAALANK